MIRWERLTPARGPTPAPPPDAPPGSWSARPARSPAARLPAILFALALAGCVPSPPPAVIEPSPLSAAGAAGPAPAPHETPSSAAARIYYAQVQRQLLSQGRLRTDDGSADSPFDDRILAENFIRIALYDEYLRTGGAFRRSETPSILRRWQVPVRLALRFGASVPEGRRQADRERIARYLARLARATDHPVTLVDSGENFTVFVVSEDEREALGPALRAAVPGLSAQDIADVTQMPRTTYCLVYAIAPGSSGSYTRAVAVIRAEHPDLLRLSCYHEEIAQGLGLANDSRQARPSIFNDDEEFALLTRMDELLLKILYDPALRPGMTPDVARPIVREIARRLMGGGV